MKPDPREIVQVGAPVIVEIVAVLIAIAAAFVWIAIYGTRPV